MGQINRFVRQIACLPIRFYQLLIRPIIKPCCRFYPSCSEYSLMAIKEFGVFQGIKLACYRLLRCHPWSDGGYDPILSKKENP